MSEPIETTEPTDAEIHEFISGPEKGEEPSYHPILEVWREVLKPAKDEADAKVTPQWASRMVQSHVGIGFADMNAFRDTYFGKLADLENILLLEIDSDPDCLKVDTPEEDVERNSFHYSNLLMQWQLQLMQWELDWDTASPEAAVELAAISETHKMFFGPTGLTAFLDNIKFEYTEDDQELLGLALQELKEGK